MSTRQGCCWAHSRCQHHKCQVSNGSVAQQCATPLNDLHGVILFLLVQVVDKIFTSHVAPLTSFCSVPPRCETAAACKTPVSCIWAAGLSQAKLFAANRPHQQSCSCLICYNSEHLLGDLFESAGCRSCRLLITHVQLSTALMQTGPPKNLQVDHSSHDCSMQTTNLVAREVTKPYCCVVLFRRSKIEVCLAAADLKQGELLLTGRSCASFEVFNIPPDLSSMLGLTGQVYSVICASTSNADLTTAC